MKTRSIEAAGIEITMRVVPLGDDLCVAVSGGREHIGAVVLAEPGPGREAKGGTVRATVSVLAVTGHREDEVAREVARKMASALGVRVSVSCGIHVDDAGPMDIQEIIKGVETLTRNMIHMLEKETV